MDPGPPAAVTTDADALPDRPDERPSQRGHERRWLPLAGVLGVILFVTLGARPFADRGEVGAVGFAGIVQVHPAPGWVEQAHDEQGDSHKLVLANGTVQLGVLAVGGNQGTADDVARSYADSLGQQLSGFFTGDVHTVALASGILAERFAYVAVDENGIAIEGSVTCAVSPSGTAIVFDARAPEGDLAAAANDLVAMIDGAEIS
jgi:hypothetical protein